MKNQLITIGIAIMMAGSFASCKKQDVKPQTTTQSSNNPMTNGKWVVTSFVINGAEHSNFYTPYMLVFKDNGVVAANGAGKEIDGKWGISTVKDHQSLSLDFGSSDPLNLLNNADWQIGSQTATMITMKGRRGDDGSESLTLKKL